MFCRLPRHVVSPCVCVFITGGPIKKQCAGEGGGMENMCQRTRLAAACADESRHLTLHGQYSVPGSLLFSHGSRVLLTPALTRRA